MTVREYMACLDAGDREGALALMDPQVKFLLALPGGRVTGESLEEYRGYLASRQAPLDRVHNVQHDLSGDGFEAVYGYVSEGEKGVTGAFMSAARISRDGLIVAYQSYFDLTFSLFDAASLVVP